MSERKRRDYAKIHAEKFKENFDSSNSRSYKDERFWVLTRDDSGAGSAVIRFLPNKNEKDLPFKPMFKHSMDINGKKFIDRCPTTIGKDCPICDWNKTQEKDFIMKNTTYRKKSWICNILVISDPKNRENEGKVFLFEFGKQIFDIIKEAIQPEDKTEEPLFYYCPDSGANFKIKVKKDGQFPTWTRSSFATPSPIDEDLETLNIDDEYWLNAIYNLDDVISENSYKEYAELKTKFNKFLSTIDMNGLSETNEMEKTQKESSESYSRMKQTAETKIEEKEEKEVKKEPAKKEAKIESKETNKKLKNYFEEISDED